MTDGDETDATVADTTATDANAADATANSTATDATAADASTVDANPPPPTVAACQLAVRDLDVEANLAAVRERVRALPDAVEVAVFPEYALTGFVSDERVERVALRRDGPELDGLRDLAATADCALLVGFVEDGDDARYNAAAYLDPDGGLTVYRKRHLWDAERDVLEPGRERVAVETPVGTAGLLTCYDLNFVGESAAFARPEIDALFVVGAWPAAHAENWNLLLRARALDGVRWVVGAGRTGRKTTGEKAVEDSTRYAGRSQVVRPDGRVETALDREESDLVATLDRTLLADCRETIRIHENRRDERRDGESTYS